MTALDTAPQDTADMPPSTRRRRRLLLAGTSVVALGTAGLGVVLGDGSGDEAPAAPTTTTAPVERTDLAERTEVDGTLGYAGSFAIVGARPGRLTWMPTVGRVIRRGERVYGVDGHSVPLFYGSSPLWRTLGPGMSDGRDVRLLETNLAALGYGDGMTVDRHFSYATKAAIMEWQDDLGVVEDGMVEIGDVVVQPRALRVTAASAVPGGSARGNLMTASSTTRQITVNLPVGRQTLARKGAQVRVELPGGKQTSGRISSVGSVATSESTDEEGPSQPGQGTQTATIPVFITLTRPSAAGRLDGAPVTVGFSTGLHKGVLAVPVTALLASPGGDYAVSVVDAPGRTRRVPVRLGAFAEGKVQVTGQLTAGMKVEVPVT
ncbi:peptidoglycan-binding protein [Actinomadura sp. HBU206391]|uniref:peptidoglycan-binding protein n=1 Tax=Actinomadura sp. HBU206391 TaxID=2731692 RepID=UPI00164F169B|nr:peptidoglycan-binding protein [Actinomadura sp. HBU206391]MBC6458616.1 peptidoglycan-binding protein [Actinomadura sp. HBU206391]